MGTSKLPVLRELLPRVDFSEYHERCVAAQLDVVAEAILGLTSAEVRLLGPLVAVRALPTKLARRGQAEQPAVTGQARSGRMVDDLRSGGFQILAEEPDGYVFASVGQPHRIRGGGSCRCATVEDFTTFVEAGYCLIVADLRATERDGWVVASTETLVCCTDDATRRAFGRYWRVIRPFSGLIRRSMLTAIDRRCR